MKRLGEIAGGIVDGLAEKLRPIPTTYRGVTYRSRLEARWAVFFEHAGIGADYEAEGYDLAGLWYLPDFFLPGPGIFVEVKPTEPDAEAVEKCARLAKLSGRKVVVVIGTPRMFEGAVFTNEGRAWPGAHMSRVGFAHCRRCETLLLLYATADNCSWGWDELEPCRYAGRCCDKWSGFGLGLKAAIDAASNERFERRAAE